MKWSVVEFNEDKYLSTVNVWLLKRHHPDLDSYDIPQLGVVAEYLDKPVAVGFLRELECGGAIFDGLASNPGATSEFRHIALDLVIETLTKQAKKMGIAYIWAWCVDTGTLDRASRHGFVKQPHTLIQLDLKNGPSH